MFKFWLYKLAQVIVNRLSLKAAYQVAIFLSDVQYFFSFRDRRAVRNNLRIILQNDQDLSRLTKEVFRNFGRYLVEFFRMQTMVDKNFISKNIHLKNIEYIDQVLKYGKGGILTTAHLGNWEMGAVVLSMLGYPITLIALPHKERPVNDLFNHQREVKGITVVQSNLFLRKCMETLANNELIAIAADRDFSQNGEVLNFLGRETLIPKGAAMFSLKTGAPIIPTFLLRQPDNRFVFQFSEPIYPPPDSKEEKGDHLIDLMKRHTAIIEDTIRAHPTQWLMFREFAVH